ncbi:DUF3800 domain-containing protein [Stackebrandtia albiflava]|nr:DUF3800 domain-containing protein [Stackebrandtia albiflava]
MLLAYVDESYSSDWYFMAAILCDGPAAIALTASLDAVVDKAVASFGVREDAELHGYELFQGYDCWQGLPPRARISVYNDTFQAIADYSTGVILRGVDAAGLRKRYVEPSTPHSIVLQHLLERIDVLATEWCQYALVIADEVDGQAQHRTNLNLYQRGRTPGYRSRKLTRIVDTLHFAPSHASRLVQAADMVAFLHRRIQTHTESNDRATNANQRLWGRLAPKIIHNHCWRPMGQVAPQRTKAPHDVEPRAGSEGEPSYALV